MRRSIPLLAAAGILTGLAAAPASAHSDAPVGGLATDQPCAPIVTVDGLVPVGIAVHELVPMVLTQEQLGATGPDWSQDVWYGRYNDDAELAPLGLFSDSETCDRLVQFGRITGYSGSWEQWTDDAYARRSSSVHLFLDEAGAAAFLGWLPGQLAPSGDGGQASPDALADVITEPIPELGPGAGATLAQGPDGTAAWAWFQRGPFVGTVTLVEPDASVAEAMGLAAELAERIEAAPRTGWPWDATSLLSAALPLAELGPVYAGFEWAWVFGGCWDAAESAEQSADPEALTERYERTGFLVRCAAMYEPPPVQLGPSESPAPPGVVRIASLVTPFATEQGAATAWAESLAEAEAAAGADFERFEVPGMDGAVGTRRPVTSDGEFIYTDTRVAFQHGPAIVTVFVHDQSETDHRDEIADLAVKLAERVDRVLPLSGATDSPGASAGLEG